MGEKGKGVNKGTGVEGSLVRTTGGIDCGSGGGWGWGEQWGKMAGQL